MAEHFVHPPHWEAYIVTYFFAAGLAGGCYVLATLLALTGYPEDREPARLGFLVPFPLVLLCALVLTLDLGRPWLFWHMLVNATPGASGLNFKYWSPMSVGAWALLLFGVFSFVSFLGALPWARRPGPLGGTAGRAWMISGALLGLYIASYTGVLLSVSNQPVWSDTWTLGGLFLASGLSGSAALLAWLVRRRAAAGSPATSWRRLLAADGYFALIELLFIVLFFVSLGFAGTLGVAVRGAWLVIWILVLASLVPAFAGLSGRRGVVHGSSGPLLILAGVLLMRIAVVISAQM
jgi:formate-dependent nitrite reductase membrane component NrfD